MDHWTRIEELFGQAIALDPADHAAFLAKACGEDVELRAQVEALLRSDAEAPGFLEEPPPIVSEPPIVSPYRAGDRLGPYRLVERLGQGGMGTVFLAERDDGAFERRVAIKILRHGTESPRAIGRLERERRILATLDHPGIARLLDGGTTPGGLPWVAMEHVDGEAIDSACERRGWGVDERIDCLLEICDALEAAHRRLVVHRDLKPSNILVDPEGHPRLLDFGIAKLLDDEGGDDRETGNGESEPTATWDRRLTPSYASPEQLRGGPITVATDVYQLGVVLYQLLCGALPHPWEGKSLAALEKALSEEHPRRPSEVVREAIQDEPPRVIRRLDPDLDHIVLRALRPEPTMRYATVAELAADLRRFRQGLPVEARQGGWRYRLAKLTRRYWLPVATASLFVLLLTAFATVSTLQAIRLERSLARRLAMEQVLGELFRMQSPEVAQGHAPTLDEVLSRGEAHLEGGTVTEPGTRGLLHALFGRLASSLGETGRARHHLEHALAELTPLDDDASLRLSAARARSDLALVALQEEDPSSAERHAAEALAMGRDLVGDDPRQLLELINPLMTVYCWQKQWEQAAPLSAEAMAALGALSDRSSLPRALALSQRALVLKNHERDPETAERLYREALAVYLALGEDHHPEVAVIHNQLGLLARGADDLPRAVEHLEAALEVRRRLYPAGHWEVAQSLHQLASLYRRLGDLGSAELRMEESFTIYRDDPDRGPAYNRTVFLLLHLAEIRIEQGKACEIEPMLLEQIPIEWWIRQRDHWLLAWGEGLVGCALATEGRGAEGQALIAKGLERLRQEEGRGATPIPFLEGCLVSSTGGPDR